MMGSRRLLLREECGRRPAWCWRCLCCTGSSQVVQPQKIISASGAMTCFVATIADTGHSNPHRHFGRMAAAVVVLGGADGIVDNDGGCVLGFVAVVPPISTLYVHSLPVPSPRHHIVGRHLRVVESTLYTVFGRTWLCKGEVAGMCVVLHSPVAAVVPVLLVDYAVAVGGGQS